MEMEEGQVLPHSFEAERAVLGVSLLDEKAAQKVVKILKEEFFYLSKHQKIFRGIVELANSGVTPDIVTVSNWLRKEKFLNEIGAEYLSELVTEVVSTANIEDYARIIFDKAMKREVIRISMDMMRKGFGDTDDAVEIVSEGENRMMRLKESNEAFFDTGVINIFDLGDDIIRSYERIKSGKVGILSPWPSLNAITLGFQPEDLCLVCGRISIGKSEMLLLLARAAWEAKHKILIVSSEIARERIFLRLLAMILKFSYKQLRAAQLSDFEEKTLYEGIMKLKTEFPLYVTGGNFEVEIGSIRRAIEFIQPEIVFIDGINLVKGKGETRVEMATFVADECKRMAKRFQIPIVASAQFNRQVKQNATRAELTQIAESDQYGRNADYVFAILQDSDLRMRRQLKVSVLKARESEDLKDFYINWDWNTQDFTEIIDTASEDEFTPF